MSLLTEILILAIFCNGLYIATEDGMILSRLDRWMENKLPLWIYKPLLGCIYCMASVWGVALHASIIYPKGVTEWEIITGIILIISGCFANGFVRTLYDLIYNRAYTKRTFTVEPEQHEGQNN